PERRKIGARREAASLRPRMVRCPFGHGWRQRLPAPRSLGTRRARRGQPALRTLLRTGIPLLRAQNRRRSVGPRPAHIPRMSRVALELPSRVEFSHLSLRDRAPRALHVLAREEAALFRRRGIDVAR